ncbi:MAG: D-lyxose/D-mannose family sugar isomerase [Planctomycetota bacterium]|nr:D-lyxose/D-mannose family sugar isomerase [Planctomycetota bacterium]
MKELDFAQALSVSPAVSTKALKTFRAATRRWKIAMPAAKPLVSDFGLGDFSRTGLIEAWIANEEAAGYCGKYMFLTDGQECPLHHHKVKHETFFIVRGEFSVSVDGQRRVLKEGQSLAILPGQVHSFRGIGEALMLELSMPCVVRDNYFEDPRIMAWLRAAIGEAPAGKTTEKPKASRSGGTAAAARRPFPGISRISPR